MNPLEDSAADLGNASIAPEPGISAVSQSSHAMLQSYQAFLRELPKLLIEHPHEWVAFAGSTLVAIGSSKRLLHRQCLAAGHREGEFLVCSIEEPQPGILDNLSDV